MNVTSTFSGDSNDGHDVEIVAHKKKKEKKEKKSMRSSFERRSSRSIGEERRVSDASDRSNGDGECHASIRDNEDGGGIVPSRRRISSASRIADLLSPSAVSLARNQSSVIKLSEEATHELADGRLAIVVPNSAPNTPGRHRSSVSGGNLTAMASSKTDETFRRAHSDDDNHLSSEYLADPLPLRLDAWCEPAATGFQVRGRSYMSDKVKSDSLPAVFRLLTVDLVKCEKPLMTGMCSHPNERIQSALAREQRTGVKELPAFVFAINLVIPSGSALYHSVFYFGVDDINILKDTSSPFGKLANKFFFGDSDAFRNATFKLIPRVVDGNFVVRKAVGSKPAILGKKIKQTYIRTNRYMELIVDIASESMASRIVTMSLGYAKTLAVDMAFLLEGNDPTTLPEQIMAAVRMNHIDFKQRDGQRRIS